MRLLLFRIDCGSDLFHAGNDGSLWRITVEETKQSDERVQVYVLVKNRLVRETLIRLFQVQRDLCIVGQGGSAEANDVLNSQCDVVVLDDLHTGSVLGSSLLDRPQAPDTVSLVLIGMQDDEEQFLEAVRSGVSGYLLNDASAKDVLSAVRAVARGEAVCPPRLRLALFRFVARGAIEAQAQISQGPMHALTTLQQQITSLVAKGLTNKEIASQLNLSESSIRSHIFRIMKRLGVEGRYEMVKVLLPFGYGGHA
jgi:DNA-binding NarL/FixJ family response regulator